MAIVNCTKCDTSFEVSNNGAVASKIVTCPNKVCTKRMKIHFRKSSTNTKNTGEETVITFANKNRKHTQLKGYFKVLSNDRTLKQEFTIDSGKKTIGRYTDKKLADILIKTKDTYISKIHCIIEVKEQADGKRGFILSDHKSTNGTFFKEKRMEPEEAFFLNDGDVFRIGRTEVKFHFVAE